MDVYEAGINDISNNNNNTIPTTTTDIRSRLVRNPRLSNITLPSTADIFLNSIGRNSNSSKLAYKIGVRHLQCFLSMSYQPYDIQSILKPLSSNEINVYSMLDGFVSYLIETGLTSKSIHLYLASVRSYLSYFDIEIVPSKFHRRVKMPRHHREPEQPLDTSNIRDILLVCSNRRLKAYLLTLASGGMRATEALAIRLKDIDFSSSPTKIHLRKEFSKTKTARDIFISQEATAYLKEWLTWKYRDKSLDRSNPDRNKLKTYTKNPNDLVFTAYSTANANNLYHEISTEFSKLLSSERVRLDERKEEGRQKRRKITLHSLRRYVKTTISNAGHQDYSEWFLGQTTS